MPTCILVATTLFLGTPSVPLPLDHVDESNQFRVVPPGALWDVLTGEEAEEVDAGTLAIWSRGTTIAYLSVDFGPEVDLLGDVTNTLLEGFDEEDMESSGARAFDFQGYPAAQETMTTDIDGQRWTISALSYRKGDFVGRLWMEGRTRKVGEDGAGFGKLIGTLEILPGEIEPAIARSEDAFGAGWLLEDGVLSSTNHGLQAKPTARWRAVAGPALWKYRPRATVGLLTEQPTLAVALTLHPVHVQAARDAGGAAPPFTLQKAKLESLYGARRGLVPVPDSARTISLLGEPFELIDFRDPESHDWRYLHGVGRRGAWMIELEGWSDTNHFPGFEESLPSAADAVSWMEPASRAKLHARLRRGPNGDDTIEEGFACRDGAYWEFDWNFVVKKPDPSWTLLSSDFAWRYHDDCLMVARHAPTGVECQVRGVVMEETSDTDVDALHRSAAAEIFMLDNQPDLPLVEMVELGGITFRRTQRTVTLGASPPQGTSSETEPELVHRSDMVLLTALHRGAFYSIVGSWTCGEEGGEAKALAAILSGITFPSSGVSRAIRSEDLYVQNAFGYQLERPADDWEYGGSIFGDHPGPKFSRFLWEGPGGTYVAAAGFDISGDASEAAGMQRAIGILAMSQGHKFSSKPGEFLGNKALILESDGFWDKAIYAAFTRGRIAYIVGSHGHSGHLELDEVTKYFSLID